MRMKKKGLALADLYPAVMIIILIGITLGVGLYVLTQTSDAVSADSKTVVNESITSVTEVGDSVALSTECGFHNFAIVQAINTTGAVLTSGNYTIDANTGVIYSTGGLYNNSDWNVTYTYQGGGTNLYCTSLTTTNTGLGGMASWIAVIVVVLAAAIVLGVVMNAFGGRNSNAI